MDLPDDTIQDTILENGILREDPLLLGAQTVRVPDTHIGVQFSMGSQRDSCDGSLLGSCQEFRLMSWFGYICG